MFCIRAVRSGGIASGRFSGVLDDVTAEDSWYMRATLYGVETYRLRGKYDAQACAWDCPCIVELTDVEHYWFDTGDLTLEISPRHFADWLVWFATRIGTPPAVPAHSMSLFAIDFPICIEWSASNYLRKERASAAESVFSVETGWPFDSGSERGEPDVGTPETPPRGAAF